MRTVYAAVQPGPRLSILAVGVGADPLQNDKFVLARIVQNFNGVLPEFYILERTDDWKAEKAYWQMTLKWNYTESDIENRARFAELLKDKLVLRCEEVVKKTLRFTFAPP